MFNWKDLVFFLLTKKLFASSYSDYFHGEINLNASSYQPCVCVPFWQCKQDYSEIVEDEIDLDDIRRKRSVQLENPCTGDWDVCCKVKCGLKNNGLGSYFDEDLNRQLGLRILGSDKADFGEFPWMLYVQSNNKYVCGASLIHPQVALTAGHCISNSGRYTIRAGEWDWTSRAEPLPYQERKSFKIIIHPFYNIATLQNDLAMIILEEPFVLTANIGVVCLPPQGSVFVNKECTASGWGKNSFLSLQYESTLKKVDMPVLSRENCERTLQEARMGPLFRLHRSFICAGGGANKDTCKGDGGSPLICPVKDEDRYVQTGIVSWGLSCGVYNTPGVYVNIPLYIEWIDEQMKRHHFETSVYKI